MIRLSAALILIAIGTAANAEWVEYAQGETGPLYYEKSRTTKLNNGDVVAWEKFVITQGTLREAIKGNPLFNNYDHTITKSQFNCRSYQYRQLAMYAYSKNGQSLFSYVFPANEAQYQDVVPESILDSLMKIVCTSS